MFTKRLITLSVAILTSSALASEESKYRQFDTPVNYNYGEIAIASTSIDNVSENATSFSGGGSFMINEKIIMGINFASSNLSDSEFGMDYEISTWNLAADLKYRIPLSDKTDFLIGGTVGYVDSELDSSFMFDPISDSDIALGASVGVMHGVNENLEISANIGVLNSFDNTGFNVGAEANYYFNENVGLGAIIDYSSVDDISSVSFGGQLRFLF